MCLRARSKKSPSPQLGLFTLEYHVEVCILSSLGIESEPYLSLYSLTMCSRDIRRDYILWPCAQGMFVERIKVDWTKLNWPFLSPTIWVLISLKALLVCPSFRKKKTGILYITKDRPNVVKNNCYLSKVWVPWNTLYNDEALWLTFLFHLCLKYMIFQLWCNLSTTKCYHSIESNKWK